MNACCPWYLVLEIFVRLVTDATECVFGGEEKEKEGVVRVLVPL